MNRKETKLLVENWRRVLDEGLNETEFLEEGKIADFAMMSAAVLSLLFSATSDAKPIGNPAVETDRVIQSVLGDSDMYVGREAKSRIYRVYKDTPQSLKQEVDKQIVIPYLESVNDAISANSEDGRDITRTEKTALSQKFKNLSSSFVQFLHKKSKDKKKKEEKMLKSYDTGLLTKLSPEQRKEWDEAVKKQDTATQGRILKSLTNN